MISAVKKPPRAEREHDVPPKLQSLCKSKVQYLYPGIEIVLAARTEGRHEATEGEEQAGNRGQPRSQSFCESAKV
jgi:hypothetical protein